MGGMDGGKVVDPLARQLAIAQEITHIGSWEWRLGSEHVTWSDELYRIYGLEPQSQPITFDVFLASVHPDDREAIRARVYQAVQRGGRFAWPERIVRPGGELRILDTVGEAITDAHGTVVGLIGTCRDVTEERRREDTIRLYSHIVESVQIGLLVFCVQHPERAGEAPLVAHNPAAAAATGARLAGRSGTSLEVLLPELAHGGLTEMLATVARGHSVPIRQFKQKRENEVSRTFACRAFPLPGDCVGVALDDVTAEAAKRELELTEQRVLELVAGGAALGDVLTTLTLAIEELAAPAIASILLVDPDGLHLHTGAAPHLPRAYNQALERLPIGPSAGSCGTALYRRERVMVTDIESDPLWADYRELARRFGLRACWSTPIVAKDDRVLGTFALYYREQRSATPADLDIIDRAIHVAAIAIQRRQLDDHLRALSGHIETAREQERAAIAREIHDVLGQELTAVKLELAWLQRRVAEGMLEPQALLDKLAEQSKTIDATIQSVRRISSELRPGELDDLGLVAALEWQAHELERRTGVQCVLDMPAEPLTLRPEVSTAIFRIFQEALTNISRHASARTVEVSLARRGGQLRFEVKDDGRGITPSEVRNPWSMGLLGMRERARALGGTVLISPTRPQGTSIVVTLPS